MKKPAWKDAREVAIIFDLHQKYKGGACRPLGEWLVARAKKTWPRFTGFRFFQKTNVKRSWVIVSYHHPAQLCWSWSLWFDLFSGSSGSWFGNGFHQTWFRVPYLFGFRLTRQPHYGWMLSNSAKQRLEMIAASMDDGAAA